jgi:hypothetical protein
MADVDALARRAVEVADRFAKRAGRLAVGTALFVAMAAGVTYLIGLAALEGSARSAWLVIGAAMLVVAAGAPLLAWWRLTSVRRHRGELVAEVRRLISGNAEAREIVIDTVESEPTAGRSPGGRQELVVIGTQQQFHRLRTFALGDRDLPTLERAMIAVTSFPVLLAVGLLSTLVFGFLALIFLVVWVV